MPTASRTRQGAPAFLRAGPRGRSLAERLPVLVLVAATALHCEDDATTFEPDSAYSPGSVDFQAVDVTQERSLDITVENTGSAGLQISNVQLNGSEDRFRFSVSEVLNSGLSPQATSTITVTYRPCPAAWTGDRVDPSFDVNACPTGFANSELVITDNSPTQTTRINLRGQPAQQPNVEFSCLQGAGDFCNMPADPNQSACVSLDFGNVVAGSGNNCDLFVIIKNKKRNGAAVAPLVIERAEVRVQDVAQPMPWAIEVNDAAGFAILDEGGRPADDRFPITLDIPEASDTATVALRIRFNGTAGTWASPGVELGLRVFTNSPEANPMASGVGARRVKKIGISASGTAPKLGITPGLVDFGDIPQGQTATATVTLTNFGNAPLTISGASLRGAANPEFTFTALDGQPIARTVGTTTGNDRFDVRVSYTPQDTADDIVFWEVRSNDPNQGRLALEVRGGPQPQICFEPSTGVLEFPIPDPPTGEARTRNIRLQNCGTGNLRITQLDIRQSADNPSSVDDFRIGDIDMDGQADCTTLPCDPMIELCPRDSVNCTINGRMPGDFVLLPVVYQNNDTSTQDLAQLVILTNDPGQPELPLTLDASDNPCLPPTVNVIPPMDPCVPQPVQLTVEGSPGGPIGNPATFVSCDWRMIFGRSPDVFSPDSSMAACTMTQFTPVMPGGFHRVEISVTNSCGASARPPPVQFSIRSSCN